ncbi:hypothetical protein Mal64_24030 [Pseudobythopirellula maris]|uniref:STAS domain-containing protein n=1 Tax=Pseudobythopirellula maris TaxID=2527991 RepID=A0A5C5ZRR6_9BACT|nr:STAS domain-containing protein [Pseudobythopirellula maris]TWT88913.1 hypothetical protein Mal64_24030 [Pseudobythopirellula maris]
MCDITHQGAVLVVTPSGPLTAEQNPGFAATVVGRLDPGLPQVVVNLHSAPIADSQGLESLLDLQEHAAGRGGEVKLAGAGQLLDEVLRITGVGDRFERFPNTKLAVGSFAR